MALRGKKKWLGQLRLGETLFELLFIKDSLLKLYISIVKFYQ